VVEELFLVNVLGPLWLAQRVLGTLAESKGFFAAISGVVAEQAFPGLVAYGASKAALSNGLAGLQREVRRQGVQVLDARPPHTDTGLATRPLSGVAPSMPVGLEPAAVALRIVDAIVDGETVLPSTAFA
jgi:cyclic-di-GMP-binding biofilm dispersal mediator protein